MESWSLKAENHLMRNMFCLENSNMMSIPENILSQIKDFSLEI